MLRKLNIRAGEATFSPRDYRPDPLTSLGGLSSCLWQHILVHVAIKLVTMGRAVGGEVERNLAVGAVQENEGFEQPFVVDLNQRQQGPVQLLRFLLCSRRGREDFRQG